MNLHHARQWPDLLEADDIDFDDVYTQTICQLAAEEARRLLDQVEPQETDDDDDQVEIDTSEHQELFRAACKREAPEWWPKRLPRLSVIVRIREARLAPKTYPPQDFHPSGGDLGLKQAKAILKRICCSVGIPFEGRIEIELVRVNDKAWLGGWSGQVNVGGEVKDQKANNEIDYWRKRFDQSMSDQRHMFTGASQVIHASASAINAMRGVNVAPPHMQMGEDDGMPAWLGYAFEALGIAMKSRNLGMAGALQEPRPRMPHMMRGQPAALRQLPGPTDYDLAGPPPDEHGGYIEDHDGYDAYGDPHGDYEGLYAQEDDVLEEDFHDTGYDDFGGGREGGNPLDGLSPEEVAQVVGEYIDDHPDKGRMKQAGMSLVPKLLG